MKKLFFFVALLLCCVACSPSARQIQALTANGLADAGNAALPMLTTLYHREGVEAIEGSKDRAEAEAKLVAIKTAWEPRWLAWEAFRLAHDAWAVALEKDLDLLVALQQLQKTYCGLSDVWPKSLPAMPVAPIACSK